MARGHVGKRGFGAQEGDGHRRIQRQPLMISRNTERIASRGNRPAPLLRPDRARLARARGRENWHPCWISALRCPRPRWRAVPAAPEFRRRASRLRGEIVEAAHRDSPAGCLDGRRAQARKTAANSSIHGPVRLGLVHDLVVGAGKPAVSLARCCPRRSMNRSVVGGRSDAILAGLQAEEGRLKRGRLVQRALAGPLRFR